MRTFLQSCRSYLYTCPIPKIKLYYLFLQIRTYLRKAICHTYDYLVDTRSCIVITRSCISLFAKISGESVSIVAIQPCISLVTPIGEFPSKTAQVFFLRVFRNLYITYYTKRPLAVVCTILVALQCRESRSSIGTNILPFRLTREYFGKQLQQ